MPALLEIRDIVKTYANHHALSGVSLTIPKGSIYGLLGPNGAGKTSLIRIITQITAADSGEILFDGEPLRREHIHQMGYLPEERGLYKKMKVGEQILYLARLKGLSENEARKRIKRWEEAFQMQDFWKKRVDELSKGMQQKVQFVATVLHEPKLLILDEPFSGFDPINADLIRQEILGLRERGVTLIFSTHRMESVEELCDHIALIHKSEKVLEGPKQEVKNRFRQHIFDIRTTRPLQQEGEHYTSQTEPEALPENMGYAQRVQLKEGSTSNAFLQEALNYTEIKAFKEEVPSVNDIFMQLVREKE